MDLEEIKQFILKRAKLKEQRDQLLTKFEAIRSNPLGAMSMMGDVENLLEMTKRLESMSDQLVQLMINDINAQEG